MDTVLKNNYDIVVIGAGPAGANFARIVDCEKYTVLLIDGSLDNKVCAGLISPDAQNILAKYDIPLPKDILVYPQLFSVRAVDLETKLIRHYRRSYINVDRAKFDKFLLDKAAENVDVIKARCLNVERFDGGFQIKLLYNGHIDKLNCRYLVGADGASSVVRKCLFKKYKIQKYVAIQQWFKAEKTDPYYSCIFDKETSSGCSWIFFKNNCLVFGGSFDRKNCKISFEKQKKKLINMGIVSENVFAAPLKTEACTVSRPHFLSGICRGGNGAYLIGEAAGFISVPVRLKE